MLHSHFDPVGACVGLDRGIAETRLRLFGVGSPGVLQASTSMRSLVPGTTWILPEMFESISVAALTDREGACERFGRLDPALGDSPALGLRAASAADPSAGQAEPEARETAAARASGRADRFDLAATLDVSVLEVLCEHLRLFLERLHVLLEIELDSLTSTSTSTSTSKSKSWCDRCVGCVGATGALGALGALGAPGATGALGAMGALGATRCGRRDLREGGGLYERRQPASEWRWI